MVRAGDSLALACANITQQLAVAGCPDAAFDAGDLCLLVAGRAPRSAPDYLLTEAQAQQLNGVAARRARREPLQYIWGRWPFLNFELAVGQGVLCPRADTEVVAELAANCCKATMQAQVMQNQSPQVLELCGGSGCIGLGIKMFCPTARVTVLEKSKEALPYLYENALHALDALLPPTARTEVPVQAGDATTQMAAYIKVVEGDLFTYHTTLPDAAFDLLVSNPPYLTEGEMQTLQPEVANEPAMALVAGADGLDFYRAIAKDYKRVVRPGGYLVLEIGCAQAASVTALLLDAGWNAVTCQQDYGKNDRCIIAKR